MNVKLFINYFLADSSVLLKIPLVILLFSLASVIGILIFGYYAESRCDPSLSGQIKKANEVSIRKGHVDILSEFKPNYMCKECCYELVRSL